MPWGKHAGRPIVDVPSGYLLWALEETSIAEPYHSAIREALVWRLDLPLPAPPVLPPGGLAETYRQMLRTGYKALSLRAHPDRGGDVAEMQRLNGVHEWARAQGLL